MQISQIGDRVQVHLVKQFEDGSQRSTRARGEAPLEVTVGTAHPRLPGLATELIGLAPGQSITIRVPDDGAYGIADPARVRRVRRERITSPSKLKPGRLAKLLINPQRSRLVRIVEVHGQRVVVDLNHPRCGQAVVIEVEIVAIAEPELPGNS